METDRNQTLVSFDAVAGGRILRGGIFETMSNTYRTGSRKYPKSLNLEKRAFAHLQGSETKALYLDQRYAQVVHKA